MVSRSVCHNIAGKAIVLYAPCTIILASWLHPISLCRPAPMSNLQAATTNSTLRVQSHTANSVFLSFPLWEEKPIYFLKISLVIGKIFSQTRNLPLTSRTSGEVKCWFTCFDFNQMCSPWHNLSEIPLVSIGPPRESQSISGTSKPFNWIRNINHFYAACCCFLHLIKT